ncbi:MAG TPA: T9SS type B sorting domain-containing protein [Flavipsychrobacter sp.]
MIGKLFTQRLLLLLAVATVALNVTKAQTVLTTTTPSNRYTFITGNAAPGDVSNFVSFDIENQNPCPYQLNSVAAFHAGRLDFGGGLRVSSNFASYELWAHYTKVTGPPTPVTTAAGWQFIAKVDSVDTDTINGITPLFSGLTTVIPANSKVRFVLYCTDTMIVAGDTGPGTITSNNITLTCGSPTETWYGMFPSNINYVNNGSFGPGNVTGNPAFTNFNFEGSVSLVGLPPTPPIADVSLKPAIRCVGQDLILKATHPKQPQGIFTWKDKNGNIIAQNTTGIDTIFGVDHPNAGRYYVTYTLCGKESLPDSGTLIISDPPAPTVSGKFDYCLNEQFEYTVVNGTSPTWYYTPTGGSPVPVTPTINTSSPNTLIYYVSQTDQYGCESRTRTLVRYRAAPKPEKPIVNTPIYYCEEMPAEQLTAIGDTLRWYYFPVGGVPTVNAPTPNTSVDDSFQYYVTQTIDGCESDRARIDVVVTFRPNGQILLDKTEICAEDSVSITYFGSAFDGSQFNWTVPPRGVTILNGFGDSDSTLVIRLDTPGIHQIKLKVGQSGCLSEEYVEEIKVKALPYGQIFAKQDVCLGQPELIESSRYTPGLDTFIWDFDGGSTTHFATEQGPYGVFWGTDGEKIVKVTYINDGCVFTESDTIMVHPKPNATIVGTYDVFDNGQKMFVPVDYVEGEEICASDSLKVTVQTVEPGATYKWTPTRFFDTYSDRPVTYARVDFSSKLYVEVEDIYGCQNKDSLEVKTKSCCEMTFPSAFSPNGDGKNDLFRPITIGRREVKLFQVFNRYGQLIFDSRQANRGWDGTMNGRDADIGTYFYQINFVCEKENVTQGGEVILVR